MASQTITLKIPGSLEHIGPLGTSIRALAGTLGVDDAAASKVELAAIEATTNAIRHALKDEPEGWISVEIELGDGQMVLTLRNPGHALPAAILEQATAPKIDADDDLRSFPEGGMGLALIKEVMSEVGVGQVDGINQFRMVFTTN